MLIQGPRGHPCDHFSMFLTSKSGSMGQKTYHMCVSIHDSNGIAKITEVSIAYVKWKMRIRISHYFYYYRCTDSFLKSACFVELLPWFFLCWLVEINFETYEFASKVAKCKKKKTAQMKLMSWPWSESYFFSFYKFVKFLFINVRYLSTLGRHTRESVALFIIIAKVSIY